MIARLRGVLIERGPDFVVVECGGVGYEVTVSLTTLSELPEPGAEVTLRVFTHAQENKIALYGFAGMPERELFDRLITVKNVGPATAIAILSGVTSPIELTRTIAAGDVPALTRIKGVGKKTADLLVVELREKCEWMLANWNAAGVVGMVVPSERGGQVAIAGKRSTRPAVLDDVASALVGLGWRSVEVDKVIARLDVAPGASVESLLRDALRAMPRP
jgi:Holliday junction DNA helicase RuvA